MARLIRLVISLAPCHCCGGGGSMDNGRTPCGVCNGTGQCGG